MTTLIHLASGLVWDFCVGSGLSSEREHLLSMLPKLPREALIVADAGFTGFAFLGAILAGGRHFLIRAGSNVRLEPTRYGSPSQAELRVMYIVGVMTDLEYSLRATAAASKKATFGVESAKRAARLSTVS